MSFYYKIVTALLQETQPTWLIEQPFTYTMWIVEQVLDGSLIESVTKFLSRINKHVTTCVVSPNLSCYYAILLI